MAAILLFAAVFIFSVILVTVGFIQYPSRRHLFELCLVWLIAISALSFLFRYWRETVMSRVESPGKTLT